MCKVKFVNDWSKAKLDCCWQLCFLSGRICTRFYSTKFAYASLKLCLRWTEMFLDSLECPPTFYKSKFLVTLKLLLNFESLNGFLMSGVGSL